MQGKAIQLLYYSVRSLCWRYAKRTFRYPATFPLNNNLVCRELEKNILFIDAYKLEEIPCIVYNIEN